MAKNKIITGDGTVEDGGDQYYGRPDQGDGDNDGLQVVANRDG